jgi:hypothetical protein
MGDPRNDNQLYTSIIDKIAAALLAIIVVKIPIVRKWLSKWPLESAIIISTVLTTTLIYLSLDRLSTWPGGDESFQEGSKTDTGSVYPNPYFSKCPPGTYAVGLKWWAEHNKADCDGCTARIQMICKPLNTLPKLSITSPQ